ncbi:hypothetical protein [Actinoallomurus rhizosphaericola]|uniref:hypothetical protein n=1 Tax=Actinoallomurus rhizosphaericola TaxID=2952536 RepID=UPI0020923D81|nr:hypothetical protein [Actinoallomurus rhizosphaericola]MCO5995286.1 hypothetical protein [Actinoallomurus rhizosphaericola]
MSLSSPRSTETAYSEELARLIAVLDRAVEEQAAADRVVRVCAGGPADVPAAFARGATRTAYTYVELAQLLEQPIGIAELDGYRVRALGLIRHHVYMLHGSLDLAFNSTLRRRRSDPHAVAHGLDRPAAELRALRLEVRAAQRG